MAKIVLDSMSDQIRYGGATIQLTRTQSRIIEALAHAPSGLTNGALIETMYAGQEPGDAVNVLKVQISRIRAKVKSADWPALITTGWGVGYRLAQPVTVNAPRPVVIPHTLRKTLERLLYSHPDKSAADQVLASFYAV